MKYLIFYIDPTVTRILSEITDENGKKSIIVSSPYNFVSNNEIVVKIVEVNSTDELEKHVDKEYNYYKIEKNVPLRAGDGIHYDENLQTFSALKYGFAIFNKGVSEIVIRSPLRFSKGKTKAYYLIHPTKLKKIPLYKDIEEVLTKNQILASVDKDAIKGQLKKIDVNKSITTQVIIASAKEPVSGYDEYFIPLLDVIKKAGKILDDGSIDYKELDSIIAVKKGQEILKKVPTVEPVDGYNIYGDKIKAEKVLKGGYEKGKNILMSSDELIYISSIDGCLILKKRKISISPVVVIGSDVDYNIGNIEFDGSVIVRGSVLPGFSVKAKENITVEMNVDDALIEAGKDVTVKLGIGGKGKSRIIAGGRIKSKYILNSYLEAIQDIEIDDSIINSKVYSNDKITVTDQHGEIIGGEIIALHEIVVKTSGGEKENKTMLSVGKSVFFEREFQNIVKLIDPIKEEVEQIMIEMKTSFGEEFFTNPKEYISILPTIKKKKCLLLMSTYSNKRKELEELVEQQKQVIQKYRPQRDPVVVVSEKTYPGTVITIKNSIKKIDKVIKNSRFYEDTEDKIIRFTPAS